MCLVCGFDVGFVCVGGDRYGDCVCVYDCGFCMMAFLWFRFWGLGGLVWV